MYKNETNLKYYLKILIYKSLEDYLVFRKYIFNICILIFSLEIFRELIL